MARPKKVPLKNIEDVSPIESTLKQAQTKQIQQEVDIEDMPLETIRDYRLYNERARAANKRLKICRYPIKPCPVELHPKQRVTFRRNDQPENALNVFVSNHLIHYDETIYPGKTYDLPECIVSYLADKGLPIWKWFDNPDGSKETRISDKTPRFSLTTVYAEV